MVGAKPCYFDTQTNIATFANTYIYINIYYVLYIHYGGAVLYDEL